ncbi:MAG: hypothetical protein O7B24_07260 [Alphaproteobacteria bacterium]|nr:hypothetical protein [Alphaproteobacteria bacterium]
MTSGPPQVDRPARDVKAAWVDRLTDNGKGIFPGLFAAPTVAIAALRTRVWPLPALMAARGLTDGIASNHGSQIKENIETRADAAKH